MTYPILAPNCTWYKGTAKRATITQINIVDSYTVTGSENESWNADTGNTGSIKCYRTGTVLTIAGNGSGKIAMNADSGYVFSDSTSVKDYFSILTTINGAGILDSSNTTTLAYFFNQCKKLVSVDVSVWNIDNVTSLRCLCQQCNALVELDVSNWNTSKVTDMAGAFNQCQTITTLDVSDWDVSNVTDMQLAFQTCTALTTLDVSNWITSKVTTMKNLFYKCEKVSTLDVSNWDVSNVTNMQQLFCHCFGLSVLDVSKWNTGKVTTMRNMFCQDDYGTISNKIKVLDVSNWDVSNVTDMGWMFYGLKNLRSLDLSKWNVSKVECFHHFAAHAPIELIGVENWDVSNCRAFNALFYNCKNKSLDLSKWDVSKGETFSQMFEYSGSLEEIKGLENWDTSNGRDFQEMFSYCTSLRKLNLSSFDTRNASTTWTDGWNNQTGNMNSMFRDTPKLQEITFGENFSFKGDGTCTAAVLGTPSAEYIEGADGNWYDTDGNAYKASAIPDKTAGTYYAAFDLIDGVYLVKRPTMLKLANSVRSSTQTTEKMTVDEMCEALNNNDAFEAGKQAERSAFWAAFQQEGARTAYASEFGSSVGRIGFGWYDSNFNPEYDFIMTSCSNMFQYSPITELSAKLKRKGLKFDTSGCTGLQQMFQGANVKDVPYIDAGNATTISYIFGSHSKVETIEGLKLSSKLTTIGNAFENAKNLTHCIFEGELAVSGLDLHWSTLLDHDSLISLINILTDYSASGTTYTLTLGADNLAKLTDAEKSIATEKGWSLA